MKYLEKILVEAKTLHNVKNELLAKNGEIIIDD